MSLDLLIARMESLQARLPEITERNMVVAANDGLALIQRRIQTTGRDSKGNLFPDYTEAYKRRKAGLTKKKIKRAEKRLENLLGTGRDEQITPSLLDTVIGVRGKYKGFVDYTLTGRMWQNTGIIEKQHGRRVKVVVGGRSPETVEKLMDNFKQRGEVLALSKEEGLVVEQVFNERMEADFRKELIG